MKALYISARNIGDAVLGSDLLSQLGDDLPTIEWQVWCRPSMSFLFERLHNVTGVMHAQFPIGTDKQFPIGQVSPLLHSARRLRAQRFDFSLDPYGDFRELILAGMAGSHRHIAPGWPAGHALRRVLRVTPRWMRRPDFELPYETVNLYAVYGALREALPRLLGLQRQAPAYESSAIRRLPRVQASVGIHPFASQVSRQWLPSRWRELIVRLQERGHRIIAFGAPAERVALLELIDGLLSPDAAVTVPMDDFFEAVGRLDVLVGLDSFSVHAAQSRGVATVMIAGSNDYRLWQAPEGEVAWSNGGCPHHPCYNKPKCLETVNPYSCIRSVEVPQVFALVEELLRRSGHSAPARDARIA